MISKLFSVLVSISWFCSGVPQALSSSFEPRAPITFENTRERGTYVTIHNKHSIPITAAVVSMRRFYEDGRILMDWTRYIDAFITEPKVISPGGEMKLSFGRQRIDNARLDEVLPRLILFEDGTWVGDKNYLDRVLNRRRAVRDALNGLVDVGNRLNEQNRGLDSAMAIAKTFSAEQEQLVSDQDERSAVVSGVRPLRIICVSTIRLAGQCLAKQ